MKDNKEVKNTQNETDCQGNVDCAQEIHEKECCHGSCGEDSCHRSSGDNCCGKDKETEKEIKRLNSECAEYKDKWMRSVAEFENFKKRNAETRRLSYLEGRADIVLKVLPIGDNLERALSMCDENTKKGIEMILKSFKQFLEGEGIEEINPVDEGFDPNYCEAIMSEPATDGVEAGYVKQVFLKGYKRGEKVLRYAQVKVTT